MSLRLQVSFQIDVVPEERTTNSHVSLAGLGQIGAMDFNMGRNDGPGSLGQHVMSQHAVQQYLLQGTSTQPASAPGRVPGPSKDGGISNFSFKGPSGCISSPFAAMANSTLSAPFSLQQSKEAQPVSPFHQAKPPAQVASRAPNIWAHTAQTKGQTSLDLLREAEAAALGLPADLLPAATATSMWMQPSMEVTPPASAAAPTSATAQDLDDTTMEAAPSLAEHAVLGGLPTSAETADNAPASEPAARFPTGSPASPSQAASPLPSPATKTAQAAASSAQAWMANHAAATSAAAASEPGIGPVTIGSISGQTIPVSELPCIRLSSPLPDPDPMTAEPSDYALHVMEKYIRAGERSAGLVWGGISHNSSNSISCPNQLQQAKICLATSTELEPLISAIDPPVVDAAKIAAALCSIPNSPTNAEREEWGREAAYIHAQHKHEVLLKLLGSMGAGPEATSPGSASPAICSPQQRNWSNSSSGGAGCGSGEASEGLGGRPSSSTGKHSSKIGRPSSSTGRHSTSTGRRSSKMGRPSSSTGRRSTSTGRHSSSDDSMELEMPTRRLRKQQEQQMGSGDLRKLQLMQLAEEGQREAAEAAARYSALRPKSKRESQEEVQWRHEDINPLAQLAAADAHAFRWSRRSGGGAGVEQESPLGRPRGSSSGGGGRQVPQLDLSGELKAAGKKGARKGRKPRGSKAGQRSQGGGAGTMQFPWLSPAAAASAGGQGSLEVGLSEKREARSTGGAAVPGSWGLPVQSTSAAAGGNGFAFGAGAASRGRAWGVAAAPSYGLGWVPASTSAIPGEGSGGGGDGDGPGSRQGSGAMLGMCFDEGEMNVSTRGRKRTASRRYQDMEVE